MGAHDFKLNMLLLFARKPGYNNVSRSAAPKLALMPVLLRCQLVNSQCLCQVSLGLKEVQMRTTLHF